MAAVVFYKFKSSKDFHSLPIDGPFISVSDFKTQIFASKRYGHGWDFDLLISDAETDQEFTDGSFLIPQNSSLSIRRLPGLPRLPIVIGGDNPKPEDEDKNEPQPQQVQQEDDFDSHDFGQVFGSIPKTKPSNQIPSNTHCKEDKTNNGFEILWSPPRWYVCRRCKVAGHYIQRCPTNGDPNYDINVQTISNSKASSSACTSSSASSCVTCVSDNNNNDMIIPEFYCQLCMKVMRDAAMTKCCFSSYCDNCIRDHVVLKSACVCLRKILVDDIVPNLTLRDIITRILNQCGDMSSDNGVTRYSDHEQQNKKRKLDNY